MSATALLQNGTLKESLSSGDKIDGAWQSCTNNTRRGAGTTKTWDEGPPRRPDPLVRFEQAMTMFRSMADASRRSAAAVDGGASSTRRPTGRLRPPPPVVGRNAAASSSASSPRRELFDDEPATATAVDDDDICGRNAVRSVSRVDLGGGESAPANCRSPRDVFFDPPAEVATLQPFERTGRPSDLTVPRSAVRRTCSVVDVAIEDDRPSTDSRHDGLRTVAATTPPANTATALPSKIAVGESTAEEPRRTMKSSLRVRLMQVDGRATSAAGVGQRSVRVLTNN